MDGDLRHDPNDDFIENRYAYVTMADFIVEATFVNPYASSYAPWDYGFIVRDHRVGNETTFMLIRVTGNERWIVSGHEFGIYYEMDDGWVPGLNIWDGGRNHLMLVAIEERGLFFVNGNFVTSLDLSDMSQAGDIAVVTGSIAGNEVAGEVTQYEGFKVDELTKEYGPVRDTVEDDHDEYINLHKSGVYLRDLVMEATFINPTDTNWSYGFTFRHPYGNRLDVIAVSNFA